METRIIARPVEGGGDLLKAMLVCTRAKVLEAIIVSKAASPSIEALTEPVIALDDGCSLMGYVYHLVADGTMFTHQFIQCGEDDPTLVAVSYGKTTTD